MSRTKKPSKLSADERAFLDRMRSLNEKEIEKLSVEEIMADLNIMHKIDPRSVRDAFEEVLIDRGLTNSEVFRLLEPRKSARNGSNSRPPGGAPSALSPTVQRI
jgi:hypothetical protein